MHTTEQSTSWTDPHFQVANLFGGVAEDISIVEFNHENDILVKSLQYQSGFTVLIDRLGKYVRQLKWPFKDYSSYIYHEEGGNLYQDIFSLN